MAKTAPSDLAAYNRLLSAARELFARKGYGGTSVREIVAAAGVTRPVLYYYFRSKEGLYRELFRESLAKLAAFLDKFANGQGNTTGRLRQFCDGLQLLFCEHAELLNLLQGFPPGTPSLYIENHHKRLLESLGQLIREATVQGGVEKGNVGEKTELILGAVYMASHVRIKDRKKEKRKNRLPRILDMIFKSESRGIKKKA